jgi:CBS domain-containing protein/osmotically-inducible protein OsmY
LLAPLVRAVPATTAAAGPASGRSRADPSVGDAAPESFGNIPSNHHDHQRGDIMAERDRLTSRNDERGGSRDAREPARDAGSRDTQGRSAAFRGNDDQRGMRDPAGYGGQGGQVGRREFGDQTGGYGTGAGGYGGYGGSGEGMGGSRWEGGSSRGGAGSSWRGGESAGRQRQGQGMGEGWADEAWSDRERWGSGGGSSYTGPSESGWTTDAGYGAGATGYGMGSQAGEGRRARVGSDWRGGDFGGERQGSGPLGDWRSGTPGGQQGATGGWGGAQQARNRGPKGWQRSDERIHDDVCERLANEHGVDPSEVTVQVSGGNVTLTGTVPDRGMKYRIEDIVDGCSGVRDVDNRLRVSRGGMGSALGGGAAMGMGTSTDARRDEGSSRGSLLGRLFGFASGSKLSDIMTRNPRTVGPDETIQKVAQLMKELDVGAIPVCSGRTLSGMVTDRDIALRAVAAGKSLDTTKVSEVMTTDVHTCREDEDVESALDKMGDLQVRRIPVVDHADRLVGIVSLGDFAQRETGDVEDALQDISKQRA